MTAKMRLGSLVHSKRRTVCGSIFQHFRGHLCNVCGQGGIPRRFDTCEPSTNQPVSTSRLQLDTLSYSGFRYSRLSRVDGSSSLTAAHGGMSMRFRVGRALAATLASGK
jgi:hypothetical protein